MGGAFALATGAFLLARHDTRRKNGDTEAESCLPRRSRGARELASKVFRVVVERVQAVVRLPPQKLVQAQAYQVSCPYPGHSTLPDLIEHPKQAQPPCELLRALSLGVAWQSRVTVTVIFEA